MLLTNNQDTQSCSNVQGTLDTLSELIFGRIRQGDMVTGTATNPALPEINYGSAPAFQEKCKRDIGIVVDAIAEDLALGGNYNTIQSTYLTLIALEILSSIMVLLVNWHSLLLHLKKQETYASRQ